jgi:hypothetical protein
MVTWWRGGDWGGDVAADELVMVDGRFGVWRWGGGGGEVMLWCLDMGSLMCRWCCVELVLYDTWFSDRFQICWDLQILFRVSEGFQICWDLQFSSYLVDHYCIGVVYFGDGLQAETYLPRFSFCRCTITLDSRSRLLDFDGPITFDSRSGVRV